MSGTQSQLSRYGAISRNLDLAPSAKVFLVGDSDDTSYGIENLAADFPVDNDGVVRTYSTIQAAVNAASPNRGDVVLVAPGSNFAHSRADTWATAGVQVIGLGTGSQRPTITYNDTAANVALAGDGIRCSNIRFLASVSRITQALSMDKGFRGQRVDNNVFTFDANGDDFVTSILLASKESVVEDNEILMEIDTAGPRQGIAFLGGEADYSQIKNNLIVGQFDTVADTSNSFGAISMDTSDTSDTNLDGLIISGNTVYSGDTAATVVARIQGGGFRLRVALFDNKFAMQDTAVADTDAIILGDAIAVGNVTKTGDSDIMEAITTQRAKRGVQDS